RDAESDEPARRRRELLHRPHARAAAASGDAALPRRRPWPRARRRALPASGRGRPARRRQPGRRPDERPALRPAGLRRGRVPPMTSPPTPRVAVHDLDKTFYFYRRPTDRFTRWLSRGRWGTPTAFHALRDVSFTVPAGTSTGIIGVNG